MKKETKGGQATLRCILGWTEGQPQALGWLAFTPFPFLIF